MDKISLNQVAVALNLRNLTPNIDIEGVMISHPDINRPALQLAGFFEHFDNKRIQIIGNVEMAYLKSLDRERKIEVFRMLFSKQIPCLVYCRNAPLSPVPGHDQHDGDNGTTACRSGGNFWIE